MIWLRLIFALILVALAAVLITAALFPFTECADGFAFSEGVVPYCGTTTTPPA